ncbi:MAG TPA: hypothetical protein VN611_13100 [Patescibacteria group bacterium]|nr:hypothetical protein [Patescibacteria group bacterium]
MSRQTSWLSFLHPDLTFRLVLIAGFLSLITLSSLVGIYDGLARNDTAEALQSLFRALLYGIPAYGILKLKAWARIMELVIAIFCVVLGFILMFSVNMTFGVIMVVIHGLIAIYLLSEECRRAFGLTSPAKQ